MQDFKKLLNPFTEEETFGPEDLLMQSSNPILDEQEKQKALTTNIQDYTGKAIEKEVSNANKIADESIDLGSKYAEEENQAFKEMDETPSNEMQNKADELAYKKDVYSKFMQATPKEQNEIQDDLKSLQEEARRKSSNLDWFRLADKIAQAYGQRHGGKVAGFQDIYDAMEKQAQQPVLDYKNLQKNELDKLSVDNEKQMNDPNSDISQFARQQAMAVATKMPGMNPETVAKLEKMSAKQLEQLGFKFSSNSFSSRPRVRYEKIRDADGIVRTYAINDDTGEKTVIGQTGYSTQFRTSGRTGEVIGLDAANPYSPPIDITGPKSISSPKNKEELKSLKSEFELQNVLDNKKYGQFTDVRKTFDSEVKEDKNAASKLDGVMKLLEEAVKNPAAAGQAKTAVAKIFEKGVLTDQDVVRYAQRLGILNQIQDKFSQFTTGTFTPELAKDVASSLKVYNSGLEDSLKNRALARAKQVKGFIDPNIPVNEASLAKMIYSDYKEYPKTVRKTDSKTGKVIKATVKDENELKEAMEEGFNE